MPNLIIDHHEFSSTKYGFSVVALLFSLLLLAAIPPIGLILLLLSITLVFFEVGIEFNAEEKKYRYFKSYFGHKTGVWKDSDPFKAQIILKKNLKGQVLGPRLVASVSYKKIMYEVNLTNESHRLRLSLKKFKELDAARRFAKMIEEKLSIPLEEYNPVLSEQTRMRRAKRGK